VYDIKVTGRDDPFVVLIDETLRIFEDCVVPGKFLVEFVSQCAFFNHVCIVLVPRLTGCVQCNTCLTGFLVPTSSVLLGSFFK
jgi:hypothetical protein